MDKLVVKGAEISVQWNPERDDFISLTDIAKLKDSDNPRYIIQNWLWNRNTIEFLGVWNLYTTRLLTVSNSMRLGVRPSGWQIPTPSPSARWKS